MFRSLVYIFYLGQAVNHSDFAHLLLLRRLVSDSELIQLASNEAGQHFNDEKSSRYRSLACREGRKITQP